MCLLAETDILNRYNISMINIAVYMSLFSDDLPSHLRNLFIECWNLGKAHNNQSNFRIRFPNIRSEQNPTLGHLADLDS